MFQVNPLLGIGFTRKIKPYFLRKIKAKNQNVVCCNICLALEGLSRRKFKYLFIPVKQSGSRLHYFFRNGQILGLSPIQKDFADIPNI